MTQGGGGGVTPSGAKVQLRQDGEALAGKTASADDTGAYTITGVAPGTYTIEVSLAGYDTGTIAAFVVSDENVTGRDLTLTKTEVLPGTYTVSGTIGVSDSGEGGSPSGASVQLRQGGNAVGSAASAGAGGAYAITGVAPGTYTIEVTLDGYNPNTLSSVTVSNANLTGQNITLTKAVVDPATYTVSGTVSVSDSGEGGSPEGAQVQLRNDQGPVGTAASADDTGAYTITDVAPGTYTIEVSLSG
ncbi:MAG: carboxypeptidase regulatory-like domain-containing protein, partial [Treponema sp.]|nr:carboxypeptidase regulatory-like domain-containing protein [Treponema sp.]